MTDPQSLLRNTTHLREGEAFAFVECPACGGEGCHYEPESRYSRWHLDPPSEISIPCDECHGTGLIWGEPAEADLEDLRERCGDFA